MLTEQQKWNRYVGAINYCLRAGYYVSLQDTKGDNVKRIIASNGSRYCVLRLKPRKYKTYELFGMIVEQIGYPKQP